MPKLKSPERIKAAKQQERDWCVATAFEAAFGYVGIDLPQSTVIAEVAHGRDWKNCRTAAVSLTAGDLSDYTVVNDNGDKYEVVVKGSPGEFEANARLSLEMDLPFYVSLENAGNHHMWAVLGLEGNLVSLWDHWHQREERRDVHELGAQDPLDTMFLRLLDPTAAGEPCRTQVGGEQSASDEVAVEDLWPGEVVAVEEKVSAIRVSLERGEPLAPIVLVNVEARTIVRDGNNRVRAWVEHHREQSDRVPPIRFRDLDRAASEEALAALGKHAAFLGTGEEGFLRMRKVPSDQYLRAQAEVSRELRAQS